MSFPSTTVPGTAVPPVDHSAHRRLVQALLRAGEPGDTEPAYALLWRLAAAEQQRAGRAPHEVELSLELLVTEVLALSATAPWFTDRPRLAGAAIEEAIAFWTGTTQVSSRAAHELWQECWESRHRLTEGRIIEDAVATTGDVVTAFENEARLRSEWAETWSAWSARPARTTAAAAG